MFDSSHVPQTQEEKDAELLDFDEKIYRAQVKMNEAMSAELKSLGVPFFGTRPDCVKSTEPLQAPSDVRPKWSPLITQTSLRALQSRMIIHLEDMYRD